MISVAATNGLLEALVVRVQSAIRFSARWSWIARFCPTRKVLSPVPRLRTYRHLLYSETVLV
jgi:hypothetical protein